MPTSRVHQSLEAKYNDTSFLLESIDGEDLEENSDAYSILSSPVGPDGLGRHLGVYSTTLLITGRMIGTGIFSAPSSITNSVGSVGAALILWVLGFALSFCGLYVWLEYGCMFPKSGGEKIYLEAAFPRPRLLATILCAVQVVLLTSCAGSSIVFAENSALAAHSSSDNNASDFTKRTIAVITILSVTIFHSVLPKWAVKVMSLLAMVKIFILCFVVLTGFFVMTWGIESVPDPQASFHNIFAGSSNNSYDYAMAFLKVLSTYQGWSTAAYVLNEVKDPVRTLSIAGTLALSTVGILYTFTNIAYFAVATPKEISESGVTVAAFFMGKVFGDSARRAAAIFAALSALGNMMSVSFSLSRVDQELAKEGILPFSSFLARNSYYGTPAATLGLVFLTTSLTVTTIPFGDAYNFILDVMGYPNAILAFFVAAGLFILRSRSPEIRRPFKIWLPIAMIFLAAQVFLIVTPFIRPSGGKGDTSLPYWLAPFISLLLLFCGVLYWLIWFVALPRMGGFSWVAKETHLNDGTILRTWLKSKNKKTGRDVD